MEKQIYRVYTNEPNNFGDAKVCIKLFESEEEARVYYNELVKQTREDQKETDDDLYVMFEEISTDRQIDFAYAKDEE